MQRHLPNLRELRPLLRVEPPRLDRRARLAKAVDVPDLRRVARRRTPRAAFDYVDGAAQRELTLARSRAAFDAVELLPRILHGTATVDLSTTIAGGTSALPFGIAPTGFTRLMQTEGEDAGMGAAAAAGIPFTLSTMGTRSLEQVAAVAPGARRWFQLYLWKDRQKSLDLLERAQASGFDTLLVTVDTPVAGQRLRDTRNGMVIPPRLSLATIADASYRPAWWFNFLTTEPLAFASLSSSSQDLPSLTNAMFDPTLSLDDLAWIRSVWPGRLFVKGILTPEDTRRALDTGADGLVVSNHGGRQLDRAPVSLEALPAVRAEAGDDVEIILDSGILSGADIVAALCAGADFTLIGRAYLYGLMAGGRAGVDRVIELLAREIEVTMQLMGAASIADLGPHLLGTRRSDAAALVR